MSIIVWKISACISKPEQGIVSICWALQLCKVQQQENYCMLFSCKFLHKIQHSSLKLYLYFIAMEHNISFCLNLNLTSLSNIVCSLDSLFMCCTRSVLAQYHIILLILSHSSLVHFSPAHSDNFYNV